MATTSLVLAICGWLPGAEGIAGSFYYTPVSDLIMVACPILAVVFGHIAIHRIRRGRAAGPIRAGFGLGIGYLQILYLVVEAIRYVAG